MHTLRIYILPRGCLHCLFFCKAVEGLEVEQAVVKPPRFFMLNLRIYISPFFLSLVLSEKLSLFSMEAMY